jgi:transposase
MTEISIVGIDLAKRVFQIHAAAVDGAVVLRRKLTRAQVLPFLAKLSPCTVAMEACATAHHWGWEIASLGHAVRLIPPIYVKPFVKRHKNDAADAEAIVEAATRPNMRFVAVKSEAQQAGAMVFRARDLLVRQRTQLINALRGHLAEYGIVAAQGTAHLKVLQAELDARGSELPAPVQEVARVYLDQIAHCAGKIAGLEKSIRAQAAAGTTTARLQTMPGIGPIAAMAIDAFAPPMQEFRRAATSPPGSGSCRGSSRPAASRSWGEPRRWASATSA